ASSGSNGTISPSGVVEVAAQSSKRFVFTPSTGYQVDSVLVNNKLIDSLQGYTFLNVSSNQTIRVTFKKLSLPSYIPANGLVGWWPFNGNANDESGNGNHGTVNGANLTSDRFMNNNSAYAFDGQNDFIQVEDADILDLTSNYTLSGWYLTNSPLQIDQTLLGKGRIDVGTGYQLIINGYETLIQFGYNDGSGLNGGATVKASTYTQGWHLLTGTYDGVSAKLYIDGSLVSSVNVKYSLQKSTQPLLFGNETKNLSRFFNGNIDDIAIWNRALSENEIKSLYNAG
ncbi:MAG: LamG domain-containing protein, partial [Saprospiraceae bacterium]|nr:LamG domain-containing protein [Saprospiraceae bacterium]